MDLYLSLIADEGDIFQDMKQKLVDSFEKRYIERALQITNGNVSAAARMSGKHRRALLELMHKHEIRPEDYRIVPARSTRYGLGNQAQ